KKMYTRSIVIFFVAFSAVICHKNPAYGKCRGHRTMWYFNKYKMRCESFIFSNCGGNTNRFFSKEECDDFCTKKSKDWAKVS
ncbi:hypothetical protein KR222_007778, partial [Zaprionus bogoriensis]